MTHILVTRQEAAQMLNLSPSTLANWVSTGKCELPIIKDGTKAMYSYNDVLNLLKCRDTTHTYHMPGFPIRTRKRKSTEGTRKKSLNQWLEKRKG